MPIDLKKDLSPMRKGFLVQGARYTACGLVLSALPVLTYARACALNLHLGPLDSYLLIALFDIALIVHGVLFTIVGLLVLSGGLAYLKRAQALLDNSASQSVLLNLEFRKPQKSINGGTLLKGLITYEDGAHETLNLVASEKPQSLTLIIAQTTQVELFGEALSWPKPRVLITPCGILLEQPNEVGLFHSIIGFPNKDKFLQDRFKYSAITVLVMGLTYVFLFSPASISLALFPAQAKPVFSISILAMLAYSFAQLIENWKMASSQNQMEKVDCQFTLIKTGLARIFAPRCVKAKVVFSDGREAVQENFHFEGFNRFPYGEPFYGSAFINGDGKLQGIVNGANALINSKVANWAIMPLVVYLVSLPFCFDALKIDNNSKMLFKSGQQAYERGLYFKARGWTEKSRQAMIEAQRFDSDYAFKAKKYLITYLPLKPIANEAEQLNIKGYNQMHLRKYKEAIATFKECIRLYPEFEWPYGNLGLLYTSLGDYQNGKLYLDKALELNPNYVNALRHLVNLELSRGNRADAIKYLDKAVSVDPEENSLIMQEFAIKASI